MSKTQLSEYKKELKDKDCKTLYEMLIPPRESKSAKKPAAKKKPAAAIEKPAAKAKATATTAKAKATATTAAAAALKSLPPSIAKELAKTDRFIKWVKAAGGKPVKPVKTVPSKKKKADDSDSDSDDSDSDLESDSE